MNRKSKANLERVFFGLQVRAPWPEQLPSGRLVAVASRHLTVAFVGSVDEVAIARLTTNVPHFDFPEGLVGRFDRVLLLPEQKPRVVAWHVDWGAACTDVDQFQAEVKQHADIIDDRPFLSHVTLARAPLEAKEWMESFRPRPAVVSGFHLYRSIGNLTYQPIWSGKVSAPFEEIAHEADIAFLIRGKTHEQLLHRAVVALSFYCPEFYGQRLTTNMSDIVDVIEELNRLIMVIDSAVGSPFKAVSFAGDAVLNENGVLEWEMIVDV